MAGTLGARILPISLIALATFACKPVDQSLPKLGSSAASHDYWSYFCDVLQGKHCPEKQSGLTVKSGSTSAYLTFAANNLADNAATISAASCTVTDANKVNIANCKVGTYKLAIPSTPKVTKPLSFDQELPKGAYSINLKTEDGLGGTTVFWPLKVEAVTGTGTAGEGVPN